MSCFQKACSILLILLSGCNGTVKQQAPCADPVLLHLNHWTSAVFPGSPTIKKYLEDSVLPGIINTSATNEGKMVKDMNGEKYTIIYVCLNKINLLILGLADNREL